MMQTSNRPSALEPISAAEETELAQELLRIQNEDELDHFLPFLLPAIKMAAPILLKAAGPLLKGLAGSLLGGEMGRSRPQDEQEHFFGGIVSKLFGESEAESEEEEQFLGNIFKGLLGGEMEAEEEQFLGGLVGKLFGGEMETGNGNYVQEQFLGGILKGIMGGEMEGELPGRPPRLHRARRFVRLATRASRRAAAHIMRLIQAGHRPTLREVRRIVAGAILATAHRLFHHHHFHQAQRSLHDRAPQPGAPPPPAEQQGAPEPSPSGPGAAPPQGETLLEMMMTGARPIAAY